jgi:hypothetical protein
MTGIWPVDPDRAGPSRTVSDLSRRMLGSDHLVVYDLVNEMGNLWRHEVRP